MQTSPPTYAPLLGLLEAASGIASSPRLFLPEVCLHSNESPQLFPHLCLTLDLIAAAELFRPDSRDLSFIRKPWLWLVPLSLSVSFYHFFHRWFGFLQTLRILIRFVVYFVSLIRSIFPMAYEAGAGVAALVVDKCGGAGKSNLLRAMWICVGFFLSVYRLELGFLCIRLFHASCDSELTYGSCLLNRLVWMQGINTLKLIRNSFFVITFVWVIKNRFIINSLEFSINSKSPHKRLFHKPTLSWFMLEITPISKVYHKFNYVYV